MSTVNSDVDDLDAALDRAAKTIDSAEHVTLMCHITPDGDALGSMLAMHHALLAAGRSSVACFPDPFVIAPHYRQLPGLDLITRPEDLGEDVGVVVTFDCGALGRLGNLRPIAEAAAELIVVDHHVSNERYGTINVIDPQAAASGVVVRTLIDRLGLALTHDVAFCLYTALVCDTGRFQYESTTPAVFGLAAELLAFDLPVSQLSRTLFEEHSFAYLQLLGEALAGATLVPEQSFVWTAVTQDLLNRHEVTMDQVEGLIDIIRRTAEADVACVLKEDVDGTVKVSLRSVGATDVEQIATRHGGGGHRFAAGFTSQDPIDVTVSRIRASL
ncbi:MAG: bifunctional oligoribonuclease/PAP phosphatase NrnA [Acidimicrobiia bacterium]|nr:bifunctional oligoribonuclease/PAP phosphatase NrnA [Acidimicrobiia bacterium]